MKKHKESHASSSNKLKSLEQGSGFKNPVGLIGKGMKGLKNNPKPPKKMA